MVENLKINWFQSFRLNQLIKNTSTVLVCLLISQQVFSQSKQSIVIDLQNTLLFGGETPMYVSSGQGTVKWQALGNKNVKAYLDITAQFDQANTNNGQIYVDRAYLKTRYQSIKMTAGKSRVSWGEGLVFNAGDVIMGSSDLNVNLASSEFRNQSKWLVGVTKSLGRFSFLEFMIVPPGVANTGAVNANPLAINQTVLATRAQFQTPSNTKVEMGFAMSKDRNEPYLSLQGGSGINWHLSANVQPEQNLNASLGLYGVKQVGETGNLNLRAEWLYKSNGASQEPSTAQNEQVVYNNYGYLEASLTSGNQTWFSRNLISPMDQSMLLMVGVNLNMYQGLNVYSQLTANLAEQQTNSQIKTYSNKGLGAQTITVGCRFVF